jgi:hypothetical protein
MIPIIFHEQSLLFLTESKKVKELPLAVDSYFHNQFLLENYI